MMNRTYFKIAGIICIVVLAVVLVVLQHFRIKEAYKGGVYPDYSQNYHNHVVNAPSNNSIQHVVLNLGVKDFIQSRNGVDWIIAVYGAREISSNIDYTDSQRKGGFVFEVSPYNLPSVLRDLRNLGMVQYEYTSTMNNWVTPTYTTYERYNPVSQFTLESLKKQRDALLQEYAYQNNQWQSGQIQAELARLAQEIQRMESGANVVDALQISTPTPVVTIAVNLVEKGISFSKALKDFRDTLGLIISSVAKFIVNAINGLIKILIFLLPLTVWVGIISLVIYFVLKMIGLAGKTQKQYGDIEER